MPGNTQPSTHSQQRDMGPEQEMEELEEKAIAAGVMKKGDDYLAVFPSAMVKMASENLATPLPSAMMRRKSFETLEIMGRLLQLNEWTDREDRLVNGVVEKVQEIVNKALGAVERMTEKVDEVMSKVTAADDNNLQHPPQNTQEDGETYKRPRIYASAIGARDVAQQLQCPRHSAAIQAAKMLERRFIVRSDTPSDWDLSEAALLEKANHAIQHAIKETGKEEGIMRAIAVQKIRGSGMFCVMRTAKEVEMLTNKECMKKFCEGWGSSATARPNYYNVVVEFMPFSTRTQTTDDLERISMDSGLPAKLIESIRWIK